MRIVLCYPVGPCHCDQIASAAPGAQVVNAGQGRIAAEILSADVFCGHAKVPIPWGDVVRQGRLRWIQSSAAGLDHCLTPEVVASDIVVTSASGVLADQVAEHALAMAGALCRNLATFFRAQQRKEFVRRPTRDLHHSAVGIVGFGGVGRRLAEVLAVFKTRIVATDWFPVDKPPQVAALWPPHRLPELLATSDIVFLAAPLTDATRGLIDDAALGGVKPGALLINMARGALVDEAALVRALESGRLGGAGLDVTATEPLPESSPLWDLPNVVITPHVAGQSARRIDDMTDFFCANLRRWQAGQPLANLVDKRLGFPIRSG
jgi:D-3-phosphoglycerate dehydrogenase